MSDDEAPVAAEGGKRLHTALSRGLVLTAFGTGALGLALGNPVFLILAATVAAALHAARAGWPGSGGVDIRLSAGRVPRGQGIQVDVRAATAPAPALYWGHTRLPGAFTMDDGANVTVFPPGAETTDSFAVGCPKRGPFAVGPATLTAVHPLMLAPSEEIARAEAVEVVVEPLLKPLRRAKQIRGRARHRIGEDRALRGPSGADFREVREYERGDPLKAVNWKLTAKRSHEDLQLMVNDFEPEARKNVWFFLDTSSEMEVGTTLDNALEDAIEATLAIVHHFTSRGHRLGGTTYNGSPTVFYPDSGTRQNLTIARGLAQALPGDEHEGLPAAVERVRGFLVRERPMVFVITRPELDVQGTAAGARRIQALTAGTRPQPVFVLAPQPTPGSSVELLARSLQTLETRAAFGSSTTLRILPLRHGVRSLDAALAKGVLTR